MKELIYIFLGGGTGSVLRYYVQELLHERIIPYSFPWATFTVNIFGSFLIGLFYALSARFNLSPEMRLLLTAGFCGGFTTFSTFSNDGLTLLKGGFYGTFIAYTLISITLGILAALAGGAVGTNHLSSPGLTLSYSFLAVSTASFSSFAFFSNSSRERLLDVS